MNDKRRYDYETEMINENTFSISETFDNSVFGKVTRPLIEAWAFDYFETKLECWDIEAHTKPATNNRLTIIVTGKCFKDLKDYHVDEFVMETFEN